MKRIEILFLVIGAILGAVLRYRISETPLAFGGLSVNILLVNMVGSFILGAFSIISPILNLDTHYTLFMSVGFCGSLTSMSSFAPETCNLLDNNFLQHTIVNVLANVFLSIGALMAGRTITDIIMKSIL